MLVELASFAALALLGFVHCAGMCGAFAIAAASSARAAGRRAWVGSWTYVLGKAMTYALLGALAASAGSVVASSRDEILPGRLLLAWLVGASLCGSGVAHLGMSWTPSLQFVTTAAPLRFARQTLARMRNAQGLTASFGVGVLTGLLPCGLSWSALLLATQTTPSVGCIGLFLFGIATGPALVGVAAGWALVPARLRLRARLLIGPALIALGMLTILRAHGEALPAALRAAVPECCTSR